jgi:hypothetical protein
MENEKSQKTNLSFLSSRKKLKIEKDELRKAYANANRDAGQRKAMGEWKNVMDDGIKL